MLGVITNGTHISTIVVHKVFLPKPKKNWDKHDKKMAQLNAKIINILYYSLDVHEFNRISTCTSVKKI